MKNAAATQTRKTRHVPCEPREGTSLRRENARVPVVATFGSLDAIKRAFCVAKPTA